MIEAAIYLLIGYCIAVIVPVPALSRFILDKWAGFFGKPTSNTVVVEPETPPRSSRL